jgi:hypothetical protein
MNWQRRDRAWKELGFNGTADVAIMVLGANFWDLHFVAALTGRNIWCIWCEAVMLIFLN